MLCVGRTAPLDFRRPHQYPPVDLYSFVALSLTMLLHTPGMVFLLLKILTDGSEDLISKPTHTDQRDILSPGQTP